MRKIKLPKSRGARGFGTIVGPLFASRTSYVGHWVQVIPTFGRFGADTEAHVAASLGAEVGQTSASLRSCFAAEVGFTKATWNQTQLASADATDFT
jgi:hypothetical protein